MAMAGKKRAKGEVRVNNNQLDKRGEGRSPKGAALKKEHSNCENPVKRGKSPQRATETKRNQGDTEAFAQ